MRILAVIVALGITVTACGGDDKSQAEEARDEVCDARGDLREDLSELGDEVTSGNLSDARDTVGDITESLGDLASDVGNLTQTQRDAVQPQVDAIRTALSSVTVSDLGSLSDTFETIRTQVGDALDTIGEASVLDCP